MSFCWNLLPPSDSEEMQFLCESEQYRVYYYSDRRTGDTVYQGQFKFSVNGSWFDDSDAAFYDEDAAYDWFNGNVNPSDEE